MFLIQTPRLLLRHFLPADLEALYALYRDPEMRRHYPDGTRTLEQTRDEMESFRNGHPQHPELGLWATVDRRTGEFLGRCGLLPWRIQGRDEVELAYMIRRDRWREGLATEASLAIVEHARQSLGLHRLICLVMPGNESSAGVARKVGMRFEQVWTDEFGPSQIYAVSWPAPDVRPQMRP